MDWRKLAMLTCVAAGCAGCVTENNSVSISQDNWAKLKGIKEADVPKHDAKPLTFVAAGALEESKANETKGGPAQQNVLRDEARKYYQKAIELDPQCVSAYIHLANLYASQHELDRAMSVFQRGLQANPKSAQLWHEQSVVQLQRKDINGALQGYAKAHELDPENRHLATQYGLCLARANRPQDAVQVLSKVMGRADACYDVARMMEHIGQPDQAKLYLQAAVADRPNHPGAVSMIAQLEQPAPTVVPAQYETPVRRASLAGPR